MRSLALRTVACSEALGFGWEGSVVAAVSDTKRSSRYSAKAWPLGEESEEEVGGEAEEEAEGEATFLELR